MSMIRNVSRLTQIKLKQKNLPVVASLSSRGNGYKITDLYSGIQQDQQSNHFHTLPESTTSNSNLELSKRNFISTNNRNTQFSTLIKNNDEKANISKNRKKNIFQRLWERYSLSGQMKRINIAERLFRAAEYRAKNPTWYNLGRFPNDFRSYHSILTMHIWFIHKRIITHANAYDNSDSLSTSSIDTHTAHLIQEELFEILWEDTKTRIRAQDGVHELTVNKHLKDLQQFTFEQCTHYDGAFTMDDPAKRREELFMAIWAHVLVRNEESLDDQINRMALYVEWQFQNIMVDLPEECFWEGRVDWGFMPDFTKMKDNKGKLLPEVVVKKQDLLPKGWYTNLTEAGETYYWNEDTMESSWEKPTM